MSLPFDTTNLLEPTEEEMKILIAAIMQNGLMVQQLQLIVALQQKEIEEDKSRKRRERDKKEEEEKQIKLREEEVGTMKMWSEEESRQYVERFRGYRGDRRYKKCSRRERRCVEHARGRTMLQEIAIVTGDGENRT